MSSYVQVGDLIGIGDWQGQRIQRAGVRDTPVGLVLVGLELTQGVEQMALVPDQGPVESSRRQVCTHRSMIAFISASAHR